MIHGGPAHNTATRAQAVMSAAIPAIARAKQGSGAGVATYTLKCPNPGIAVCAPAVTITAAQEVEVWPLATNVGNVQTAHDPAQAVNGPYGTFQQPGAAMQTVTGINNLCEIWMSAAHAGDGVLVRVVRL